MNINSNRYVFTFAAIVCVTSGVLLSFFAEALRPIQERNEVLDVKKNILKAVVLEEPVPAKAKPDEVLKIYADKIEELVIDDNGQVVEGKKPADITSKDKNLHPLYIYKEGSQVKSYAFPVSGMGLWSVIYGYMAIEADATTVRGITFYKHGETPGLGGEVEKEWFQHNFKGKKIYDIDTKNLTPIVVVKGKVAEVLKNDPKAAQHSVDGITAATITANGVTAFMDKWIKVYDQYLSKVRRI